MVNIEVRRLLIGFALIIFIASGVAFFTGQGIFGDEKFDKPTADGGTEEVFLVDVLVSGDVEFKAFGGWRLSDLDAQVTTPLQFFSIGSLIGIESDEVEVRVTILDNEGGQFAPIVRQTSNIGRVSLLGEGKPFEVILEDVPEGNYNVLIQVGELVDDKRIFRVEEELKGVVIEKG